MKVRLFGFRSGKAWRKAAAIVYYAACAMVLVVGMLSPPLVAAGLRDTVIFKVSVLVITLWLLSPALLLSDTPLRKKLPLFKQQDRTKTLIGMMVAFLLFTYLFAMVESWHTPEYKAAVDAYYTMYFLV